MTEITGTIDHRILLNYRIDPQVMQRNLPDGFQPLIFRGFAIGGICQVSLSGMRPKGLPMCGTASHNTAHRIAVVTSKGEGVYVPRRDTDSWLNVFSGGRLFPGIHYKADFRVDVAGDHYKVDIRADDGRRLMTIEAALAADLPEGSVFKSVTEVSEFFRRGNIGWSPKTKDTDFDAIELQTVNWNMEPLHVSRQFSAYFSDTDKFPSGSVTFDSALIMRDIKHSWVSREHLRDICC